MQSHNILPPPFPKLRGNIILYYLLDIKALINFCIVKKYNHRTWAPDEFFELLLFVGSLQPLGGYRLGRDLQFDTLISSYEE